MSPLSDSQQRRIDHPPLIVAANLQTGFQRYGFRVLTILFWVMFLFLFRVALTPLAWLVGAQSLYEMFSYKVESQDFADLMLVYTLVVIAIGVCLIGWARYNTIRFSKNERRTKFLPPTKVAAVAEYYQISQELIRQSSHSRRLVFRHAEDGQLLGVAESESLPLLPAEPVPVEVNSFSYKTYLLHRDEDLRWSVYQDGQQLFHGGTFNSCLDYVDSIAR